MSLLLLGLGAAVTGCSTPCDGPGHERPGRLCAPISSITSPAPQPATQTAPPPPPRAPETPPPEAQTFAVAMPGAASAGAAIPPQAAATGGDTAAARPGQDIAALPSNRPIRMALLLPMRSETLGSAAESVRAGFMAAWERDRDNVSVDLVDTGDVPQDVLASYARALEKDDIVVGPLARSAVTAVAASPLVSKPTIALNSPEGATSGPALLPPQMLAMGLSIEEEARQAAQWAAAEHPGSSALILSTSTPWQRRVAAAFAAQWQRAGLPVKNIELSAPNGYLSDPELVQLRARLQADMPGVLFSALGADQTRQLRGALSDAPITGPDTGAAAASAAPPATPLADTTPAPSAAAAGPAAAGPAVNPPAGTLAGLPIYGTSALNAGSGSNTPTQELDGVRLLDLPWQVQRDHPAVMVYPRPPQGDERKPGTADMDRLYALGIDAYRVAREISRQPAARFHLDGVTGQLTISFGLGGASFERVEQAAVYKNGVPLPVSATVSQ